jgi:hypothetical protein
LGAERFIHLPSSSQRLPFISPRSAPPKKLSASQFVNRSVGVLHNVELVIDDAAVRRQLLDAQR